MKSLLTLIIIGFTIGCASPGGNSEQTPLTDQPALKAGKTPILHGKGILEIKTAIERQKHLEDENNRSSYTEADVEIAIPFLAEALKESGFQAPDHETFRKKVRALFGSNVFDKGNCQTRHHNKFISVLAKENGDEYDYTEDNVMISTEYNFIFSVPFLSDFIKFVDDKHYTYDNVDLQLARNNYLLNSSSRDFSYLVKQDTLFLKSLVRNLGYTSDQQINDVFMNDIARWKDQEIPKVCEYIFFKDCHGQLQVRKGLLQWISTHSSGEENRMALALYDFSLSLYAGDASSSLKFNPRTYFNRDQKRMISAYIINTWVPLSEKYVTINPAKWSIANLLDNLIVYDPELPKYFINYNYFSLPQLRAIMESRQ